MDGGLAVLTFQSKVDSEAAEDLTPEAPDGGIEGPQIDASREMLEISSHFRNFRSLCESVPESPILGLSQKPSDHYEDDIARGCWHGFSSER